MVYDSSSASDVATAKGEASYSGWGVGVSAEFSKTESSSSSASSIYFDYWRKKIYNPDPSNIKEFGVPLSDDFKSELLTAYADNKMDDFYKKWGNFFVFGFTRGVTCVEYIPSLGSLTLVDTSGAASRLTPPPLLSYQTARLH